MTQLEYFKAWAKERYPNMDQTTDEKALEDGTVLFLHDMLQMAWRAFQYRYTIRPTTTMANHTFNKEEFRKDDPETIVDRLRGCYPQVDPPYKTSLLEQEAAREIEQLRGERDEMNRLFVDWWLSDDVYSDADYFNHSVRVSQSLSDAVNKVYSDNKKPAEAG